MTLLAYRLITLARECAVANAAKRYSTERRLYAELLEITRQLPPEAKESAP